MWTSAQRAWQPFGPPRTGPSLFTGVWRANPQWVGVASQPGSVSPSTATALHVSVSQAELLNIARSKDCMLPGVSFSRKKRSWCITWLQNKKKCATAISVGRFEKQGMTEDAASLTALRAAIAKRNEKVTSILSAEKHHFDEGDLQAMVETKTSQVPGVSFHHSKNAWQVQWCEQRKLMACYFPLTKFKAHDVTETAASMAALRTAIDFRARKVGLQDQRTMKLIKVIPDGS